MTWTDTAVISRWQLYWKSEQKKKCVLSFVFYGQKNFHLVKFIVNWRQCIMVVRWQYNRCVIGAGSVTVVEWMWRMNQGVVGLPRWLVLFNSASKQACDYCSTRFKVLSFLRHHLGHCSWKFRLQEGLLQVSSSSSIWWTSKNTHGVLFDASSMLTRAWWSILTQNFTGDETWVFNYAEESKAESMTWKDPHSPVKKKFKTVQSPGKVLAAIFMDVYGAAFVDFTPPDSTINAVAYQETLERIKRGYSVKETRIFDHRISSFAWQCWTSQFCCNCESLELLWRGNSSISTIQSYSGTAGLPSVFKYEKAPHRSAILPQFKRSKWGQEKVMYPRPTLLL